MRRNHGTTKKRLIIAVVFLLAMIACTAAFAEGEEGGSSMYGTFWSLLPPIIAIGLALITKEVYTSLFVGIVVGCVLQNITAGLRLQGVTKRQTLGECAEETLRRMDIYNDFKDMLYLDAYALTRSQAQLTCIARALALKPGLLLLDEPTRLLDTMTSIKVEDMLFKLKKECTMVVAVHTPQMAGRIAKETAMMEDGTVLEWSRTSDLFYHPQHLHTEQFVSAKFA